VVLVNHQPIAETEDPVAEARAIAAQWQSPGSIGKVLAAVASGIRTDRHRLIDDIRATIRHDKPSFADHMELERLREWAETDTDLLTGPADGMRVFTNWHVRDVLRWHQLTPEEREEFDYYSEEQAQDVEFVRYRGEVIVASDVDGIASDALKARGWDTYASDSFFSGLVFKWFDKDGNLFEDGVIVGRYVV
jgi:hypothetical protein